VRPGAAFAYVSWLQDERAFRPDEIFDDLLDELDIDDGDDDPGRPGDLPSVDRAAGELRRAGFADVTARAGELVHPFTVEGYIGFMAEFHEESLIESLDPEIRARFLGTLRDRLTALTPRQMTMRFPIVFASGRRSR
jgi:hypothetical protein